MFSEVVPVILHEDDLNAMTYSMENRSPFLDRELFEFVYSLPSELLISDGKSKNLLRRAMTGIVPDVVLNNRKKVGFNAPLFDLLDPSSPETLDFINQDSLIYDYVRKEKVLSLLAAGHLENSSSKFLFNVINAKIFMDMYSS